MKKITMKPLNCTSNTSRSKELNPAKLMEIFGAGKNFLKASALAVTLTACPELQGGEDENEMCASGEIYDWKREACVPYNEDKCEDCIDDPKDATLISRYSDEYGNYNLDGINSDGNLSREETVILGCGAAKQFETKYKTKIDFVNQTANPDYSGPACEEYYNSLTNCTDWGLRFSVERDFKLMKCVEGTLSSMGKVDEEKLNECKESLPILLATMRAERECEEK